MLGMAALIAISGQAAAATTDLGALAPPASLFYGDTFSAPQSQFYDDYLFSIPAATFSSITSTINLGELLGIDNLQSRLYSGTTTTTGTPGGLLEGWSTPISFGGGGMVTVLDPVMLGAGDYILEIRGDVVGTAGGSYSGVLNVSPVPEAGETAMLLLGVGLIGFVAARRKRDAGLAEELAAFS